jgi:hypothetical protein
VPERHWQAGIVSAWLARVPWVGGYLLFFLMLAFPMVRPLLWPKAGLFAVLLALGSLKILVTGTTGLHRCVLVWSVFLAALGLGFTLYGAVTGAPGAFKEGEVFVVWPLVYTVLVGAGCDYQALHRLYGIAVAATNFIGLYGIAYALSGIGAMPHLAFVDWFSFAGSQAIGLHRGFIGLMSTGLNSLPFLFPMAVVLLLLSYEPANGIPVSRKWLWLAVITAGTLILFSARRALFVIAVLGPVAALMITAYGRGVRIRPAYLLRTAVIGMLIVVVAFHFLAWVYPDFSLGHVWRRFVAGFNFNASGTSDSALRARQFVDLGRAWLKHPFFGYGLGAVGSFVRSKTVPWSYELSYVALLFHTGIVGVVSYSAAVFWLSRRALKVAAHGGTAGGMTWPVLVGMYGMLIANATNPYLERFDGLWAIFWLVAVVNFWTLEDARFRRSDRTPWAVATRLERQGS